MIPLDNPDPVVLRLRAGATTMDLVGPDLFELTFGDTQVAQRIYVAVRDEVWNTIPGAMTDIRVDEGVDRFSVVFEMRHAHGEFDFTWTGTVTGRPDSSVSFAMDGRAGSDFRYAKIGFNVHHRLGEHIGRAFRASGGPEPTAGVFPEEVAPQLERDGVLTAMFAPFDRLECDLPGDLAVHFEFDGDLFETQDHRNWADANFKSYGTPLAAGFPMDAHAGDTFHQVVTVRPVGEQPRDLPRPSFRDTAAATSTLDVAPRPPSGRLPATGVQMGGPDDLPPVVLDRLRALAPAHLRVDVHADGAFDEALDHRLRACSAAGSPLELAVYVSEGTAPERLSTIVDAVRRHGMEVVRVLAFAEAVGFRDAGCTPEAFVALVAEHVAGPLGVAGVVGGTDQFFSELTRTPPATDDLAGINFALNPQVHACDDRSLMDNAETVRFMETSATTLGAGLGVHVSTVSLLGPNGPFPAGPPAGDDPVANVDARQGQLFCAAWTVGFLANAARAGIASVTCFELLGGRGVVADDSPGTAAVAPDASTGDVFPVFHVLAELCGWGGHEVVDVSAPQEERVFGILDAQPSRGRRLVVANGNGVTRWVTMTGVDAGSAVVHLLDDAAVGTASRGPGGLRATTTHIVPVHDGVARLALAPWAVALVEWPPG